MIRLLPLLLFACTGPAPDETGEPVPPERCGTAGDALPDGLVELAWDDGTPTTAIDDQTWAFDGYEGHYVIAEQPLHEAVRFELAHPARIHGFAVHWAGLPDDPEAELEAGIYPDFGHNGFDFWQWDPHAVATRCAGEADADGWLVYALDEPIEVTEPGLVYVAHRRGAAGEPSFSMDGSPQPDCDAWDRCHGAVNLPETEAGYHFPGWSFPLPADYLVRLYVEHTEERPPEARRFQEIPGVALGSRVSWGDYDGDGHDDLMTSGLRLWRNQGDGTFVDATEAAGLSGIAGDGGVWGDYDNDGCLDFFAQADSYSRADVLLRSACDGTFTDVTAEAGINDVQDYELCSDDPNNTRSPTAASAWWDIDGDGLLDLYMANMICWASWRFYADKVWHNRGDGTFEDWSGTRGFASDRLSGRGAAPADADADGDVDLLVNNYTLHRNLFYRNAGDGTVAEAAAGAGLAGHAALGGGTTLYYGHSIGAAWGDLDGDGLLDAVVANLAHPRFWHFSDKTQVLLNDGDGTFTDIAEDWTTPESATGLRYQETHSVPVLADFDLDGALDLVVTAVYDGRPTDYYRGHGDGTFSLASYEAGITTENGWGVAASDLDNDGDPDLATYTLWENTGDVGRWFQVRAIGNVASNRAALGATVRVEVGATTVIRHVSGGNGQGGQDSATLVFGLGDAEAVDAVEIDFPGGGTVRYEGPFSADQRLWAYEDGATHLGWAPAP